MPPRLGILAGGGDLPGRLIEACRADGRDYFVVAFQGHADPEVVGDAPHLWAELTDASRVFDILCENAVTQLVMAGRVRRPSWGRLRSHDRRTARFLGKIGVRALGDDGLLRAIARRLEEEGFQIVGPDDVVHDLLAPEGQYGRVAPDAAARLDIDRGVAVARTLGTLDFGHAVVVRDGVVLGVEAVEGTDALLERCQRLAPAGPGGVLVKCSKPGQDRRLDLPTIGPATVTKAAEARLRGIAVEAGRTLVLDKGAVAQLADKSGLFVVGIPVPR
ncbi:MAG: LpxI family protein [Kiloniellales bacterium]